MNQGKLFIVNWTRLQLQTAILFEIFKFVSPIAWIFLLLVVELLKTGS